MRLDYIVKKNARIKQDKVALVDVMAGEKSITYGEYNQRCINFANYIINNFGVNPDDRIALLLENSIEICIAYYSIPKTSAITVPLNFFMAKRELAYCINDSKPVMLIYGDRFADDINYYEKTYMNHLPFLVIYKHNQALHYFQLMEHVFYLQIHLFLLL